MAPSPTLSFTSTSPPPTTTTTTISPTSNALSPSSPSPSSVQTTWQGVSIFKSQDGVSVIFDISKPQPTSPQFTLVNATFTNNGPSTITDLELKLSLPKYLKLQLLPLSNTTLSGFGGSSTQQIKLANTAQGEKPVMMRLRLEYKINGEQKAELVEPRLPEGI